MWSPRFATSQFHKFPVRRLFFLSPDRWKQAKENCRKMHKGVWRRSVPLKYIGKLCLMSGPGTCAPFIFKLQYNRKRCEISVWQAAFLIFHVLLCFRGNSKNTDWINRRRYFIQNQVAAIGVKRGGGRPDPSWTTALLHHWYLSIYLASDSRQFGSICL